MDSRPTVIGALRRFLPEFLPSAPPLSPPQHRALWAIAHCRTAALGGRRIDCARCGHVHLAFHSCNHKACPQCGRQATQRWIERQLANRIQAPYFLVTFRWKDRSDHDRIKPLTLPGVEFVTRYLRHVLPIGLRSVRYYGFCHPAAKANRLRLQLLTAMTVDLGAPSLRPERRASPAPPCCPRCGGTELRVFRVPPVYAGRGPPAASIAPQPIPAAA